MRFAPGSSPKMTLEQEFDLQAIHWLCSTWKQERASDIAVKLRRENQLLRATILELSNELDRATRGN
jgi:hypothetical protein